MYVYVYVVQRLWSEDDVEGAAELWSEMVGQHGVRPNEEAIVGMIQCYATQGTQGHTTFTPHLLCLAALLSSVFVWF